MYLSSDSVVPPHPATSLPQAGLVVPVSTKKPRPNAFGHPSLVGLYRTAKQLVIDHNLLRMCQYAEIDGIRQLTICNLWRLERGPDNNLTAWEFELLENSWHRVTTLDYWPDIPFHPIAHCTALGWSENVIKQAIWKALIAAGYQDIELPRLADPTHSAKKHVSPRYVAKQLIQFYLGDPGQRTNKRGFLNQDLLQAGAKALRAAFCKHILDGEVLSAALVIDYKRLPFKNYVHYAIHRPGFLKVAQEHRNLLPLLPFIAPKLWLRDDLFSQKLWVKKDRKTTLVDRSQFRQGALYQKPRLKSFTDNREWRWLNRASSLIVRQWTSNLSPFGRPADPQVISQIAWANSNAKAPVLAYVTLIANMGRYMPRYGQATIQKLIRLFLAHCALLWQVRGYAFVRTWLRTEASSEAFSDLFDYLNDEGIANGQPKRNATWASLCRLSADWHTRIALEELERANQQNAALTWCSALPETCIDDRRFTPLDSHQALALEGYQLHHCIGAYADQCYVGQCRVFSVLDPNGSRSTLGMVIQGNKVIWDQHRGNFNGPVADQTVLAGQHLVALYQHALRQKSGKTGNPSPIEAVP